MSISDIILLTAYVIGTIITVSFQAKKINTLKSQVNSQNDIISNMQKFMNIFSLDVVEKYVKMNKELMEAEKAEATKKVEGKIKSEADNAIKMLLSEFNASFSINLKLIGANPYLSNLRSYLSEIDKDSIVAGALKEYSARVQKDLEVKNQQIVEAALAISFQQPLGMNRSAALNPPEKK